MKFDRVKGKCVDLSFEGKGVVKLSYGTVFVDGLFPGEEAEIEIQYKRAGSYFGKVYRLITKSKDRIQPRCGVCTACGGCQLQQLSYQAQLEYKQRKVQDALRRHGLEKIAVLPTIGMENPYEYRNKIQVPIGRDPHGHIISGFYRQGTHKIIPIEKCEIEDPRATKVISEIKKLMKEFHYAPYDEDTRSGLIRHVLIRTSYHYDQMMVTMVTRLDEFKGKNNFVRELHKRCPIITSIVQNINSRDTNVILGEKERLLFGPATIKDSILGVDFLISSKSFFQVNPVQVEILYQNAIDSANITSKYRVFDAYCGIGTIALIASKKAFSVVGVEIVKEAIIDANKNAKLNNITNAEFFVGDAGEIYSKLKREGRDFDCVFVDPPRKGLTEEFINYLLEEEPPTICYVSCDPETLARDLALLSKKYSIGNAQPVDMFPMTFHVETICALSFKGQKQLKSIDFKAFINKP